MTEETPTSGQAEGAEPGDDAGTGLDRQTRIELEAAAFRGLRDHLRRRTDVQNIDLMSLAGFCRNCLSKWLHAAAEQQGVAMSYDQARRLVYGMDYQTWKARYQQPASAEQQRRFEASKPGHARPYEDAP